jgi:hypothetical protein
VIYFKLLGLEVQDFFLYQIFIEILKNDPLKSNVNVKIGNKGSNDIFAKYGLEKTKFFVNRYSWYFVVIIFWLRLCRAVFSVVKDQALILPG